MLKGLKSVRKFYLKDSKPAKQQQRPLPVLPQDDSEYAPSSWDEKQASAPADPWLHAAEAPLTPTHPQDGSSSGEEFDESELWQAVHDDEDNYPFLSFGEYISSSNTFFTTLVYFPFSLHLDPYQPAPEGSKKGPIFGPLLS